MEENKWKKKAKITISILIFFYTIYLATLKEHIKFEDPGSNKGCEIGNRIYLRERKMDK